MKSIAFHLAFPVSDLNEALGFYRDVLGCKVGRTSDRWIDFEFFGHQITAHLGKPEGVIRNSVDRHAIPVPHFGCILSWEDFKVLRQRLEGFEVAFEVAPYLRFEGEPGEQATMFISDPSQNFLEFKAFKNPDKIFSCE